MGTEFYDVGSGLAVPGLEAIIEYGDASTIARGRIPGAMAINDLSPLEWVRVEQLDGVHANPDGRESRQDNAGRHGERSGNMLFGGRTIGLTGKVEAGSIPAVRDTWSRFSSQFGTRERDLLLHPPAEVQVSTNLVPNPEPIDDVSYWARQINGGSATMTGGVDEPIGYFKVGRITATSVVQDVDDSILKVAPIAVDGAGFGTKLADWNGEDVLVQALVRVHAASSTPTALKLIIYGEGGSGGGGLTDAIEIVPTTGTWYWLSARVDAASIRRSLQWLTVWIQLEAPDGTYTMYWTRARFSLLAADDPTPVGYISAEIPGFEPSGVPRQSPSCGPCYAVNMISDPLLAERDPDDLDKPLHWDINNSASVTVDTFPQISQIAIPGAIGERSIYYKAVKDATATSRKIAMTTSMRFGTDGTQAAVSPGRTYALSMVVNVITKPTTDKVCVFIEWVTYTSTVNSATRSESDALPIGASEVQFTATAPADAVFARVSVGAPATTQSGVIIEIEASDPCFIDVTDFDPGAAILGDGRLDEEVPIQGHVSGSALTQVEDSVIGVRRRIPRPFLIKGVRMTSEGPRQTEQQVDRLYRRDFTMGMRASDPRIYVFDQRRVKIQMVGTPSLVSRQAPTDFTLNSSGPPTPAGYTSEGSFTTNPGGTPYKWLQYAQASNDTTLYQPPLGGVALAAFDQFGEMGANGPTQDLVTRYYRSLESLTYNDPKVIIGGSPQAFGQGGAAPFDNRGMMYRYSGSAGSRTYYCNKISALLKRKSSTSWLELRWSSMSRARAVSESGTAESGAPYAFELWSSHDTSGSINTTRLATWDYASYDSANGLLPFRPLYDPMWLVAYLRDDVVYWELWSGYPSEFDTIFRLETGSYELTAGLIGELGSTHAGHTGWSMRIMSDGTAGPAATFQQLAAAPPYLHYFEASDAAAPPKVVTTSVIGSIDTPLKLDITGMTNPIITIHAPEYGDQPARSSTARFIGTISTADTITIDLTGPDVTIKDQYGVDQYGLLVPGSDFIELSPGVNYITLQAENWDPHPAHLVASWRDALKSG